MPLPRPLLVASLLIAAVSLQACGDDPEATGPTSTEPANGPEVAGLPVGGGALARGAATGGLPSVVAVSITTGGTLKTGTGTLLAEGSVVTDARLVTTASGAPASGVTVREGNGEEHTAVVDGIDRLSGLAALRVRELAAVPVAKAATTPVALGQEVAGLGFLSARRPSLRPGAIVTGERAVRDRGVAEVGLFESTTTVGSQGFGGPVVDREGKVLGIATQALPSMVPGAVVSVPIRSARRIARALASGGRVPRSYLGIESVAVTPTRAEELRLTTSSGVILRAIAAGSPAAFAPFRKPTGTTTVGGREIPSGGDVIVGIDRSPIVEPEDLDRALANRAPGRRVQIKVIRGDRAVTIPVTLGER